MQVTPPVQNRNMYFQAAAASILAIFGALLIFLSGAGYTTGFPQIGLALALTTSFGIFCLLAASFIVIGWSQKVSPSSTGLNRFYGVLLLGFVLILSGQFSPFPVGCNVGNSCPADPVGAWSTIWPNELVTFIGAVSATWGFCKLRSSASQLIGIGPGLAVGGFLVLVLGLSIGYMTSCPANGCPPLTADQRWAVFWQDVIAEWIGAVCIVAGLITTALGFQRSHHTSSHSEEAGWQTSMPQR